MKKWTYSLSIDVGEEEIAYGAGRYSAIGVGNVEFEFDPTTGVSTTVKNYDFYGDGQQVSLYTPSQGVITNVTVDLVNKTVSTIAGQSFFANGNGQAQVYLGDSSFRIFNESFSLARDALGNVSSLTGLTDASAEIAVWMLAVGSGLDKGDGFYGSGLLSTNVGLSFNVSTGSVEASNDTNAILQAQKDRLETMANPETSAADKKTASEEFWNNMPNHYKSYFETLGITSADQFNLKVENVNGGII